MIFDVDSITLAGSDKCIDMCMNIYEPAWTTGGPTEPFAVHPEETIPIHSKRKIERNILDVRSSGAAATIWYSRHKTQPKSWPTRYSNKHIKKTPQHESAWDVETQQKPIELGCSSLKCNDDDDSGCKMEHLLRAQSSLHTHCLVYGSCLGF